MFARKPRLMTRIDERRVPDGSAEPNGVVSGPCPLEGLGRLLALAIHLVIEGKRYDRQYHLQLPQIDRGGPLAKVRAAPTQSLAGLLEKARGLEGNLCATRHTLSMA